MFVNISKISNQVSEMIVSELTNYEDGKESRSNTCEFIKINKRMELLESEH